MLRKFYLFRFNPEKQNLPQEMVGGGGWGWCPLPLPFSAALLFVATDKRKYIKKPYAGKKRKTWNKLTKPFPNKWKRKLAKSNKGSYYNQGKWINEHQYGKGWCYNEYYNDNLDLVITEKSSCGGESEAESK